MVWNRKGKIAVWFCRRTTYKGIVAIWQFHQRGIA
jgi:hypothetical protein